MLFLNKSLAILNHIVVLFDGFMRGLWPPKPCFRGCIEPQKAALNPMKLMALASKRKVPKPMPKRFGRRKNEPKIVVPCWGF